MCSCHGCVRQRKRRRAFAHVNRWACRGSVPTSRIQGFVLRPITLILPPKLANQHWALEKCSRHSNVALACVGLLGATIGFPKRMRWLESVVLDDLMDLILVDLEQNRPCRFATPVGDSSRIEISIRSSRPRSRFAIERLPWPCSASPVPSATKAVDTAVSGAPSDSLSGRCPSTSLPTQVSHPCQELWGRHSSMHDHKLNY